MGPQAYMLKANEELFEKTLVPLVEDILKYIQSRSSVPIHHSCVCTVQHTHTLHRKGGGIGDTNIRKMAYFESFVDDSYKASVQYLLPSFGH